MRLIFLGTGSGTEPVPGYRHVSFAVEWAGGVYWFDAGEGCAYTAHTSGVDLLSVRAIFISHTHTDHIGGLANLIWTIRKLGRVDPESAGSMAGKTVSLCIPDLDVWEGVQAVVRGPAKELDLGFDLQARRYEDGVIYDDGDLRVSALHNRHLGEPEAKVSRGSPSRFASRPAARPSCFRAMRPRQASLARCSTTATCFSWRPAIIPSRMSAPTCAAVASPTGASRSSIMGEPSWPIPRARRRRRGAYSEQRSWLRATA